MSALAIPADHAAVGAFGTASFTRQRWGGGLGRRPPGRASAADADAVVMAIDDPAMLAAVAAVVMPAIMTEAMVPTMIARAALIVMVATAIVALGVGSTSKASGSGHDGNGSEQHLEFHGSSFVSAIAARGGDYEGGMASFLSFR